jgi:hypothetical protein
MGYGGIIKTVVRVAASTVGGMVCGPPCAAIGSALATGATGGSFKESLMAGATSFIGSSITRGLSNAANASAGANAIRSGAIDPIGGSQTFADIGLGGIGPAEQAAALTSGTLDAGGSFVGDLLAEGVNTPISDVPIIGDISDAIGSQFDIGNFGQVGKEIRSGADFLFGAGDDSLFNLGLDTTPLAINSAADLAAAGVGSLTELTLNQALNADLEGLDEVLGQRFSPQQIQILRNEARNALSQEAFERLIGPEGVVNPFPDTPEGLSEFQNIIASGIERENIGLGPDITESQFRTVFDDPNLGQAILSDEEALRRQSFGQQIGQAFPGDAFQSLDDNIISSIVEERQGPAQQQISRFGARGNLNPTGGQTANLFIQQQVPKARERVGEVGAGVLGGYERDIGEIRGRAEQQAGGYKLGEDLFDVTPFSEERAGLIEERQGTLGSDVRSAIGSEPLFDVSGALRAGGRAQGVVSGRGQNQALLDQIAARELGSTSARNRRSLGSRGSGAF